MRSTSNSHSGRRSTAPRRSSTPALLGGTGLVVVVLGTFLPWLRSGSDTRNSYQAGGAVRRLIATSGLLNTALGLWPLVGLACAAAVALNLLGFRTISTALAGLTAIAAGAASIAALTATANRYAAVAVSGPVVTLSGATLSALAVLLSTLPKAAGWRSPA